MFIIMNKLKRQPVSPNNDLHKNPKYFTSILIKANLSVRFRYELLRYSVLEVRNERKKLKY